MDFTYKSFCWSFGTTSFRTQNFNKTIEQQLSRVLIKIQSALWKLDMNEKPVQDKKVIELGSIDKQIMLDVFNEAYSQPAKGGGKCERW